MKYQPSNYKIQSKKAFTILEMIFVIVILGILGAVVIPKLTSERDKAKAAFCAEEVSGLVLGIVTNYSKLGYSQFQELKISELSALKTGVENGDGKSGIRENPSANVVDGITYQCTGDAITSLTFSPLDHKAYNLIITTIEESTTPISLYAIQMIASNFKTEIGNPVSIPISY
jgi:prepilin-type N-terminal cleavage/methylation domain-containing protein